MAGMNDETTRPGALWALIQQWMDGLAYPPSARRLADRLGVSSSALNNWKYRRGFPTRAHIEAIADEIGVSYDRVLEAVLIDQGYRDPAAPERRGRRGA